MDDLVGKVTPFTDRAYIDIAESLQQQFQADELDIQSRFRALRVE